MSIRQKIKDEERKQRAIAEEKRRMMEEVIQTSPVRLECKRLVPIVSPIIRELANETNLLLRKEEDRRAAIPLGSSSVSHSFAIYELNVKNKTGWFSVEPSYLILKIYIGNVHVNSYLHVVTSAITLHVPPRSMYEQAVGEVYDFDSVPKQAHLIKDWFTDALFRVYQRAKFMHLDRLNH